MAQRKRRRVSYETREELAQTMRLFCPCAMDDPYRRFYLAIVALIERETRRPSIGDEE